MDITEKRTHIVCLTILTIGLLLKLIYAWQVPYNISPHDLDEISNWVEIKNGHLGYIQYLFQFKSLPAELSNQFYHPPLFYMIGAVIFQFALAEKTVPAAINTFEIIQYINMLFSFITTIYIYHILKKLQIKPIWLILITAFITLQPCFYIIGTEINNDCLMTMFSTMAIFYTVSWIQRQSMKNACFIAISVIAAMLSKTSGALIAICIGCVFLYTFVRTKNKNILVQIFVFVLSMIALGMSWILRCKILHHTPLIYIPKLANDSPQYVGNSTLLQRIGIPSFEQLFGNSIDFSNSTEFSNIWGQLAITMSFDEYILHINSAFKQCAATNLLWLNMIMFILMTIIMIKMFLIKNIKTEYKILIGVGFATLMGSFLKFVFDYPHICSMNFRYIVCSIIFLGMALGLERSQQTKFQTKSTLILTSLMLIITILSTILYLIAA